MKKLYPDTIDIQGNFTMNTLSNIILSQIYVLEKNVNARRYITVKHASIDKRDPFLSLFGLFDKVVVSV